MSPVEGKDDFWEITLIPRQYYGLQDGDYVYWVAMVFRNADGSVKGTGTPGEIKNGIIDSNLDFFIRNMDFYSVDELVEPSALIYPNPTSGYVNLSQFPGDIFFQVYNNMGQLVFEAELYGSRQVDLGHLESGIYFYRISAEEEFVSGKIVIYQK
jgi:hypothetical protein